MELKENGKMLQIPAGRQISPPEKPPKVQGLSVREFIFSLTVYHFGPYYRVHGNAFLGTYGDGGRRVRFVKM